METIQTSPSTPLQGPLTMTSFLENSGTNNSCHHLENRAENTADCANKDMFLCSEQSLLCTELQLHVPETVLRHWWGPSLKQILCGCLLLA